MRAGLNHLFNGGTGVKGAEIVFKEEALLRQTLEGALVAYVTLYVERN